MYNIKFFFYFIDIVNFWLQCSQAYSLLIQEQKNQVVFMETYNNADVDIVYPLLCLHYYQRIFIHHGIYWIELKTYLKSYNLRTVQFILIMYNSVNHQESD